MFLICGPTLPVTLPGSWWRPWPWPVHKRPKILQDVTTQQSLRSIYACMSHLLKINSQGINSAHCNTTQHSQFKASSDTLAEIAVLSAHVPTGHAPEHPALHLQRCLPILTNSVILQYIITPPLFSPGSSNIEVLHLISWSRLIQYHHVKLPAMLPRAIPPPLRPSLPL